ncbi:TetR family transcriptional regulator [Vibrio maerlii]|uniref:TetR family transcriptional regulator n=1 Tax=Vibrio maerlii TaxID=2231648 RepID=UPI000E3CBBFD|nr:TetR family transcriptional regulator [Vibrio maerlii]
MARISTEEKARKQAELNAIILDIFWNEGIQAVTYAEIAKRFGTTKSTIQRYFPTSDHFPLAWEGKIGPIISEFLDWSSKDNFEASWMRALENENDVRFRRILEVMFVEAAKVKSTEPAKVGVERFKTKITQVFNDETVAHQVFGRTFCYLMND